MNNFKFEDIRKSLLKECYELGESTELPEEFRRSFFKLIEYCIFTLMEQKENFFAHFIVQLKREILLELPTAAATKLTGSYYTIYFNPIIFLECTLEEMKALLKHEVYHIISLHHIRAKSLLKLYSAKAVNTAMDISVNQYILNLPLWSEKLENASLSYNVRLKEEDTIEEYSRLIQEAINKFKKKTNDNGESENTSKDKQEDEPMISDSHDMETIHDLWRYSDEEDYTQVKEITKKLVNNSARGEIPESVGKIIAAFNEIPEINWTNYLKRLVGTLPSGYKKTVTRKDRRQPDRLDIRGRLSRQIANIIVAIDISGSMSDKEIEKIMTEVISIVKNYNYRLTILECDSHIRRVYTVKKASDIKPKLNTKGGTKFTPVFEYVNKNFSKESILIYFTDGIGEKTLDTRYIHRRVLWVLTGNEDLSLVSPPGSVKKLTNVKKEKSNMLAIEYLKNEMKEIRSEWAK